MILNYSDTGFQVAPNFRLVFITRFHVSIILQDFMSLFYTISCHYFTRFHVIILHDFMSLFYTISCHYFTRFNVSTY